jgi:hypothetical protein
VIELEQDKRTDAEIDSARLRASAHDLAVHAVVARERACGELPAAHFKNVGPLRAAILALVESYVQTGEVGP